MTEELKKAGGTTKRIADIQMEGLKGAFIKLQSATEGMFIAVGKQLSPALISLANDLKGVVTYIQNDAIPAFIALPKWMQKLAIGTVAAGAAAGPLLLIFGQLGSMLGGLMLVISGVAAGLISWGAVAAAATATAVLLGKVLAVVGVAIAAWKLGRFIAEFVELDRVMTFFWGKTLYGLTDAEIRASIEFEEMAKAMEGTASAAEVLQGQLDNLE